MRKLFQTMETYWLALSLALLAIITTLSLWPLDNLLLVPGSDKLHHFIAYSALVFPVALSQPQRWILVVIFFILCSGLIELIQPFVGRHGDINDFYADALGSVIGVCLIALIKMIAFIKLKRIP